ncbi:MAG TPA: sigma-54 dependent transcriptional regulator [Planctomycetota bacterium]|nr:sigma-54 dependent transcriptional regulator [Planctomycetota bacterium]
MDETRQLTREGSADFLERVREKEAKRQRLEHLARHLRDAGSDPQVLGGIALEGLLDILDFERGFIFSSRIDGEEPGPDGDAVLLEHIVSRTRRGSAERGSGTAAPRSGDWATVRNPEFAVSRSVIKRAIAGKKLLALNDCLLEPTSRSKEQHRAVLSKPFDLIPGVEGVLYLDRGLGRGEIGENETSLVEEFSQCCLVLVSRAALLHELAALRARLVEGDDTPAVAGGSDGAAGAPAAEAEEEADLEPVTVPTFFGIVGEDEKLQKILRVVEKVKDSDLNICIFGESGTGKELLARAIHESGSRNQKLFVAENCGAIAENLLESELFGHAKGAFTGADEEKAGLFDAANGGTLFLDEIGDMSEGMQRKLLRVLEEGVIRPIGGKETRRVDVRVICASNRDLKVLVQKGIFRADLYYRLNVVTIEIPPLRERARDIPGLVSHIAAEIGAEEGLQKRFSRSALKALVEYPWPGNIRELKNVIRSVLVTCPGRVIARKDLAALLGNVTASPRSGENIERDGQELLLRIPLRDSFNEIIEECERVVILNALKQCAWNKSRVTKALKIPRQSLYNKIDKFQIERDWGEGGETGELRTGN